MRCNVLMGMCVSIGCMAERLKHKICRAGEDGGCGMRCNVLMGMCVSIGCMAERLKHKIVEQEKMVDVV